VQVGLWSLWSWKRDENGFTGSSSMPTKYK
jgi:hypothetical protein